MPINELPPEILEIVMSCLPIPDLQIYREVSRSWAELTELTYPRRTQSFLLKRIVNKQIGFTIFTNSEVQTITDFSYLPIQVEFCKVHGYAAGMVCITFQTEENIFLYNLESKCMQEIPKANEYDNIHQENTAVLIGLGYNKQNDEIKIVRVTSFGLEDSWYHDTCKAQVYTLKEKKWRNIIGIKDEAPYLLNTSIIQSVGVSYEGDVFWSVVIGKKGSSILSFDTRKERFNFIPVPIFNIQGFGFLEGRMVVFCCPNREEYEIWEKVGKKWKQLLRFGPIFGITIPLGFLNSKEIVFEEQEGNILVYDIKIKNWKQITVNGEL